MYCKCPARHQNFWWFDQLCYSIPQTAAGFPQTFALFPPYFPLSLVPNDTEDKVCEPKEATNKRRKSIYINQLNI